MPIFDLSVSRSLSTVARARACPASSPSTAMASSLHIVMLPWLAMGHLLPFLELSKRLARRGHRISLLTTPSNIRRLLPAVPPHLSSLIHLVELRMPSLADHPENTNDLDSDDARSDLAKAYRSFEPQVSLFLQQRPVDWILHDYSAAAWAPRVAADRGVAHAFLCLFNAAAVSFFGGPRKETARPRSTPEDFTTVPEWIPFPSTVAYRLHEARQLFKSRSTAAAVDVDASDRPRASNPSTGTFMAIRSCYELEDKWLELLSKLSETEVVPLGLFPPSAAEARDDDEVWLAAVTDWLDEQELGSVVYAAFGSEAKLTREQAAEIALGLELSGLPFVWAATAAAPPEGFEERMEGRGMVCRGWVPQVKLLSHPAVGGFLTHGGWNSIVEGLSAGAVMVVLPLLFDQGLNARHMVDMGMAVEVPRDEEDGRFTGEGIAGCLRMAMVEEVGEGLRKKAREYKEVFADEELQDRYIDKFIEKLWEHRKI